MPGYTATYQLPYLLGSEGLHTTDDVTKQLADRLETLISNGTLKGAKGDTGAPGGPNGPAVSVLGSVQNVPSGTLYYWSASQTTEYDLRTAGGSQVYENGVIASRAGLYAASLVVPWVVTNAASNSTGDRVLKLIDAASGNAVAEDVRRAPAGNGMEFISQLAVTLSLTAGQKITGYIYQTSGATISAGGTQQGGIKARLSLTWLGPSS